MKNGIIREHFDRIAPQRAAWFEGNRFYHNQTINVCRQFLDRDSRVLELGCSTGQLLGTLNPQYGVGVDFSPASIHIAREMYPNLNWLCANVEDLPSSPYLREPFDLIIIEDLLGYIDDIQTLLETIKALCHPRTRIIVSTWNWLWGPFLWLGESLKLKAPDLHVRQNWLSASAIQNFLELAEYETLRVYPGLLMPYPIPFFSDLINSLSYAPVLQRFTLLTMLVARPAPGAQTEECSVSVIIPTRNEKQNIRALLDRMPRFGARMELIFVDGNSQDGTVEEIQQAIQQYPELDIQYMPQIPPTGQQPDVAPDLMLKLGKGDAVRKGFSAATGDILMILDSDITVPPEELPKFYHALTSGKARFANGTRFAYAQQSGAMRPVNRFGNLFFSLAFSWLLGQRITDTLCGTKVLFRQDYEQIAANRRQFGDFDPFGDFDLLFGAAWLGYSIIDVPIHYKARQYGTSKVRVSSHGPLLGRMSLLALWYFKIRPLLTGRTPRALKADVSTARSANRTWFALLAFAAVLLVLGRFLWRKRR